MLVNNSILNYFSEIGWFFDYWLLSNLLSATTVYTESVFGSTTQRLLIITRYYFGTSIWIRGPERQLGTWFKIPELDRPVYRRHTLYWVRGNVEQLLEFENNEISIGNGNIDSIYLCTFWTATINIFTMATEHREEQTSG